MVFLCFFPGFLSPPTVNFLFFLVFWMYVLACSYFYAILKKTKVGPLANRKSGCARSFFCIVCEKRFEWNRPTAVKRATVCFGMWKCVFFGFWVAYLIENSNVLDVTGILKNCG